MAVGEGPWHSVNSEVYHDNPNCQTGSSIEPENILRGTGDKRLCKGCERLNRAGAEVDSREEGLLREAEIGEDDEVRIPVVEEEVVVEKRPVVKEEIRVRKDVVEEEEVVEEDVRREEIEIEDKTERRREAGTGRTQQPERAHSERRAEEEEPSSSAPPRDEGFIDKARRKLQE